MDKINPSEINEALRRITLARVRLLPNEILQLISVLLPDRSTSALW